eukprot:TRINITY_DN61945_c0_g1_i2.p1 TRINITY_DN61945_c0_g1~~TRINITY_DN61945_c0_g1_i2.p1  ORF type:complete len:370 (-),score=56.09 TRINITY_DN61945_c0_g1_i2:633-1742(-)
MTTHGEKALQLCVHIRELCTSLVIKMTHASPEAVGTQLEKAEFCVAKLCTQLSTPPELKKFHALKPVQPQSPSCVSIDDFISSSRQEQEGTLFAIPSLPNWFSVDEVLKVNYEKQEWVLDSLPPILASLKEMGETNETTKSDDEFWRGLLWTLCSNGTVDMMLGLVFSYSDAARWRALYVLQILNGVSTGKDSVAECKHTSHRWYDSLVDVEPTCAMLGDCTFPAVVVKLTVEQCKAMVVCCNKLINWFFKLLAKHRGEPPCYPMLHEYPGLFAEGDQNLALMQELATQIQTVWLDNCANKTSATKFFVKLSTRSPKDSIALRLRKDRIRQQREELMEDDTDSENEEEEDEDDELDDMFQHVLQHSRHQ